MLSMTNEIVIHVCVLYHVFILFEHFRVCLVFFQRPYHATPPPPRGAPSYLCHPQLFQRSNLKCTKYL
jgi:hypothetical protein